MIAGALNSGNFIYEKSCRVKMNSELIVLTDPKQVWRKMQIMNF